MAEVLSLHLEHVETSSPNEIDKTGKMQWSKNIRETSCQKRKVSEEMTATANHRDGAFCTYLSLVSGPPVYHRQVSFT
jgi:hypothetical protein